jgi:ribonuclease HIII
MSQTVIKVSMPIMEKMKNFYKNALKENNQASVFFHAKVDGCTITAYVSGKVLFQGPSHKRESIIWEDKNLMNHSKQGNLHIPSCVCKSHVGSDEAGTGDFFGPITACAVYVEEKNIPLLQELGVKDSKKLSDKAVMEKAEQIQLAEIPFSLLVLPNPKYNELQSKGWTQGKMKVMLHYHVIENVLQKIANKPLDGIVVDQFAAKEVFSHHLATEKKTLPDKMHLLTKAESYSIAVACASILSRAKFLQEMHRLSKLAGISLQKGASKLVDEQAAKIILNKGKDFLSQIAKIHYANTAKAEELVRKKQF